MAVVIKVGETEAVSVDIGEKVYIQGDPGFSPTIEVTDITGGHRLTITDINGDKTVDVMNGAKGDKGDTGNGIEYITLNADYTLTVHYTNGTEWTSTSIRGEKGDKGDTGTSISGAILNADYTLTLTFTDGSSYTTPPIRGAQGERGPIGPTPDISIGTVTTGAAGSQAEATMTGTPEQPVLNLTIPRGDPGEVTQAEFDDLAGEVAQQKSAIEALDSLVDRKAGMLVDSVSGAIASFVPDSTIDNLLGVSVAVEPVQDLHGYDSPWPAGGGKNLLPIDSVFHDDNTGNIVIFNGSITGTFTLSADTSGVTSAVSPAAALCVVTVNGENKYDIAISNSSHTYTGTITNILVFAAGSYTQYRGTVKFQLESGSTATSWTPYSNICPISGWDSVEVEADGINIWDEEWEVGGLNGATGGNWNTNTRIRSKNYIPVKPETTYYNSEPTSGLALNACYYSADKSFISAAAPGANTSFTTPNGAFFMRFATYAQYGTTYNHDISINYPSTDHGYHPYSGNRYTIQLGQTVYGGTLTIAEDGSVKALVDRAMVDLGTLTWYYSTQGTPKFYLSANLPNQTTVAADLIFSCSAYKNGVQAGITSANLADYSVFADWNKRNGILVTDSRYTDVTSFRNAVSGVQLVYRLAIPIEIQLDPVTISTISGQTNNVWADAGDVSVEFAADLKTYIDRLNQPTEDDMIANSLIASGKYFTVNNRLFLSTASIAAGAQIIPGTNCTETSLAAALNALNA